MLSVVVGLALLVLTPGLWRGTRTAVSLAIAGLAALAAMSLLKSHYEEAAVQLGLTTEEIEEVLRDQEEWLREEDCSG